ncbi:hypothetical protein B0H15DRAFT_209813 [Mycena belliarum]|uniref:C2H2-type domain-containing protein n=1 Tax=Mycena belliarum TaxID=1033014 RepID=A0AAD6XXQ2_9AGAR|nr:hypothetical protein B0H15DRAFT_209813 [Mycena belliae]
MSWQAQISTRPLSRTLHGSSSPVDSPYFPNYAPHLTTGSSPLFSPMQHTWPSFPSLDPVSELPRIDLVYIQDPVDSTPLSPVFPHLSLLGSGSPKPRDRSLVENPGTSPILLAHEPDVGSESLLFGPTPLPHYSHSAFARTSTSSRTQPNLHVLTSDRLGVPPRRQSFNSTSDHGRFFFAGESNPTTPDTPSVFLSPSPSSSVGPPELTITRPQVASPASIRAANSRRKKPAKYICEVCKASFTANHNLKNHMNSHRGYRPFECEACQMRYVTPGVLKRHQKTCAARRGLLPSAARSSGIRLSL